MMHTIEIKPKVQIGLTEIIREISKLETTELENIAKQLNRVLAQRKAKQASLRESALLSKIKEKLLSDAHQQRYEMLHEKLESTSLSSSEHKEYLEIIKQRERKGLERLEDLVELSTIRKVSLDELLLQLGMNAPFPEYA